MATIKSYTNIEQSRKLAEFLPLDSADMFYDGVQDLYKEKVYNIPTDGSSITVRTGHVITDKGIKANLLLPCWSLAALLGILPLGLYDESDSCDYELEIDMIAKMPRYIRLGEMYHSQFPYDFEKDTLLDNIVESIIWLNDNNYFEL